MRPIRQLIRQPLKTLFGILLITLAVAVLCVCVGQAAAASVTQRVVNDTFHTQAFPTDKFNRGRLWEMPSEVVAWIEQTAKTHPELVKTIYSPGLASAYIPGLKVDNYTHYDFVDSPMTLASRDELGTPFSCAMLEITLVSIEEPMSYPAVVNEPYISKVDCLQEDGTVEQVTEEFVIQLTGTINRVIGLEEGFVDPTGWMATLTLHLPDEGSWEALGLIPGERYLVYGTNYVDWDWEYRQRLRLEDGIYLKELKWENLHYYSDAVIAANRYVHPDNYDVAYYYDDEGYFWLFTSRSIRYYKGIAMDLVDKGRVNRFLPAPDGNGFVRETEYSYTDINGDTVSLTSQEFAQRYQTPVIARLDGTAEEFLASAQGALWRETLENIQVNVHAFPVIGVDRLDTIAEFATEQARVVEGRDFSQEELQTGAKVCLLSKTLADANGLRVGDRVTMQTYNYDYGDPSLMRIADGRMVTDPAAYPYSTHTPLNKEETYTVIGLYHSSGSWRDREQTWLNPDRPPNTPYHFTDNTIFTPKNAVQGSMDYGVEGVFRTLELQNGYLREFQILTAKEGYDGLFAYADQGYTQVADSLHDYQRVGKRAVLVGGVVYGIILALFLLLFPARQGSSLDIMGSMGTYRIRKLWYVEASGLGILLPGTVLGCGVGALLWKTVVEQLAKTARVVISVDMDVEILLKIAVVQLLVAALLVLLLAAPMTRNKSLMKRK